jgi:serine/threonine protein kinase
LKPIFTCSIIYRRLPLDNYAKSRWTNYSCKTTIQKNVAGECHYENVLYQVATGLEYIHKMVMTHRDNKP